MARPQKVSDEQIQNAILQAHAEGKSLSVREIQARVGGGDMKRISQALGRFKKDNGLAPLTAGATLKSEALDEQELKRAIEQYKAMKQSIRQAFLPEQQLMQAELLDALQSRDDALNENERLSQLLEQSEERETDLSAQLSKKQVELAAANGALKKADEKIKKLEEANIVAEKDKVSAETQRDQYAQQLNDLNEEIKRLRSQAEEDRKFLHSLTARGIIRDGLSSGPITLESPTDGSHSPHLNGDNSSAQHDS